LGPPQHCSGVDPPAAEYPPNSPKKQSWPKIRRKKMRLAENPPNRKFAATAEKNCGYCVYTRQFQGDFGQPNSS